MLNLIVAPYNQNPQAEKHTKKVVKILKREKAEYSVYFSNSAEDVSFTVENLVASGETEFVLIGDDALIHQFVNAVKDISKVKIGIVATSKHNDFASYIGIAPKPVQAIKDILEKNIETVDYLLVNNSIKVVNNLVVGATAEIFEIFKSYKIQNSLTEKYANFKYANKFEGIELGIVGAKNTKIKFENMFELSISNGGLLEGKQLSPLSCVQDGLMNLNYVTMPAREERKKYLKLYKKGNQVYDENTKQLWLPNVKIVNPDKRIKIMADEVLQTVNELNVEVVENGLKIFKRIN